MKKNFLSLLLTLVLVSANGVAQSTYSTERGFRHPGGLHTESDFNRIKQQLKEGNQRVTEAYNILKSAGYAQSNANTYPTENIVRGGGSGENYMNAARGATIAYQNALRWKIEGNKACARHAVEVLMAWARTTKLITGDSNAALAAGLYGYQFAQAAELVRDYEGWDSQDFATFKQWMMQVWYPANIGFLRGRNGTWENSGRWWRAPGHYWSNWGLCNALCVLSIGVLCDDVYVYNQALSFLKHDQCGTFKDPRTDNPILNDGLTEFWGNLIVTTASWDQQTGAYGKVGQMQESGRDVGHPAMAAGLAVDIAQMCYNQGNDLFSFMDHRLAAGIEYIAAQVLSVEGLPWTNYKYGTNGIYYTDSRCWEMTGPCMGVQIRPLWQTVVSHYRGVKGVDMPFSERVLAQMGIDGGGSGSTSGGYDQLGYTVLTHSIEGKASAEEVPTEISPVIINGTATLRQNELGGLRNTYTLSPKDGVAVGTVLTLAPELPEGTTDTGKWRWNTGDTTRQITFTANRSYLYRVIYTNAQGVDSECAFSIAVYADCQPSSVKGYLERDGVTLDSTHAEVLYGGSLKLTLEGIGNYETYRWSNNATTRSITLTNIRKDSTVVGAFVNQGGAESKVWFRIKTRMLFPSIQVGEVAHDWTNRLIVTQGDSITLVAQLSTLKRGGTGVWTCALGSQPIIGNTYSACKAIFPAVTQSDTITLTYTRGEEVLTERFILLVKEKEEMPISTSCHYLIRHVSTDSYLTSPVQGVQQSVFFAPRDQNNKAQVWKLARIARQAPYKYSFQSMADSLFVNATGLTSKLNTRPFCFCLACGLNLYNLFISTSTGESHLTVDSTLVHHFQGENSLNDFVFQLIPVEEGTGIAPVVLQSSNAAAFTLSGIPLKEPNARGFYIINGKKVWIK